MPVPRWGFAVAVLNDSLLVMGGYTGYNKRWSFICDWFETIIIINAFAGHLAPGSSSKVLMPSVWQPAGLHTIFVNKLCILPLFQVQGCISCGILVSGIGARGVSSEHMENMEMFSCSPT